MTGTEVLWGRSVPATRKNTPPETMDSIAHAAIVIADREGLAGLSVKRVAAKVGLPVTALSAYLTSKDDLLDLIFDAFYAEIDPPATSDSAGWRGDLTALATATRGALQRHPWALELMGARPPYGPHGLRSSERALATLDGLGLDSVAMTSAVNTVLAYVCGSIRRRPRSGASMPPAVAAEYLVAVVSSGDYPRLTQVFADTQQLTEDASFAAGLSQVLDGIAARLA